VDHEGSFCGSEGRGSDDEVAFIFAVRAVENKNEVASSCEKKVLVGGIGVNGLRRVDLPKALMAEGMSSKTRSSE